MPSLGRYILALAAVLGTALADDDSTSSGVIPPSQDPWYQPPEYWACKKPGEKLRIRPAPGNITAAVPGASKAYNIMYRTTDTLYKPAWAVTTLFIPSSNPNPKALVSYQVAYDSHNVDDSPSHSLYKGLAEAVAWNAALGAGWFLNVPDYEGPNASFTLGVTSGYATLDSVRVVLSLQDKFGLDDDVKYAMWGYSGGALASEWAAELQVQYAPELQFAGAAIGGLTPNVTSVLYNINGNKEAGLAPSALWGQTVAYPEARKELINRMQETGAYNRSTFLYQMTQSVADTATFFAYQNISMYFVGGFSFVSDPAFAFIWYQNGLMGYHGTPNIPLYVYKAVHDQVSSIADTDALVARYCDVGVNILYERNTIGGHADDAVNNGFSAFTWLGSLFSGTHNTTYKSVGCTIRDTSINITSTGSKR